MDRNGVYNFLVEIGGRGPGNLRLRGLDPREAVAASIGEPRERAAGTTGGVGISRLAIVGVIVASCTTPTSTSAPTSTSTSTPISAPASTADEETEAKHIDSLVALGRIGEAHTAAMIFVQHHPSGPFSSHVMNLMGVHPRPPGAVPEPRAEGDGGP